MTVLSFLRVAFLLAPFIAASELRGKISNDFKSLLQTKLASGKHSELTNIATKGMLGAFPAEPVYVSWMGYEDPTCSFDKFFLVGSFIADVCFSNSTTNSQMFRCGKIVSSFILCVFFFTLYLFFFIP
jgi:hypothetical protein